MPTSCRYDEPMEKTIGECGTESSECVWIVISNTSESNSTNYFSSLLALKMHKHAYTFCPKKLQNPPLSKRCRVHLWHRLQERISWNISSPDLRRLDIKYSFSFIVVFACLYLSSRSSNASSVSSSFFCCENKYIQSIYLQEWQVAVTKVGWFLGLPVSSQVCHLILHSIVVENCKALGDQLIAAYRAYINRVGQTTINISL